MMICILCQQIIILPYTNEIVNKKTFIICEKI
jgi:hypothetical protein